MNWIVDVQKAKYYLYPLKHLTSWDFSSPFVTVDLILIQSMISLLLFPIVVDCEQFSLLLLRNSHFLFEIRIFSLFSSISGSITSPLSRTLFFGSVGRCRCHSTRWATFTQKLFSPYSHRSRCFVDSYGTIFVLRTNILTTVVTFELSGTLALLPCRVLLTKRQFSRWWTRMMVCWIERSTRKSARRKSIESCWMD